MDPDSTVVLFRPVPPALRLTATEKNAVKNFAFELTDQLANGRTFTCVISGDGELRKLNNNFIGHDYPTDVLSFPSEDAGLGDIAISVERAAEQAHEFGHSRIDEIRVLMLHGLLHLLGYDHERDKGEMARAERKWRAHFQLPVTLIGRSSRSTAEVSR